MTKTQIGSHFAKKLENFKKTFLEIINMLAALIIPKTKKTASSSLLG